MTTATTTAPAGAWQRMRSPQGAGEALRNENGDVRVWCDSLDEFLTRCDSMHDSAGSSQTGEESWTGTANYEAAGELARSGWAEPRATVQGHREAATTEFARAMAPRWTVEHVRVGGVFDPVRDRVGSQFCWQRPIEHERPMTTTRVHRVNVPIAASSGVEPDEMLEAGAAVVALVDVLRILGHTLEVVVTETVSNGNGSTFVCGFLLHKAGDVVDVDRLAYWLAHPSALRRHVFACNESLPQKDRQRFGFGLGIGNYGYPATTPQWALDSMGVTLDVGNVNDRLRAIREGGVQTWMASMLERLGIG